MSLFEQHFDGWVARLANYTSSDSVIAAAIRDADRTALELADPEDDAIFRKGSGDRSVYGLRSSVLLPPLPVPLQRERSSWFHELWHSFGQRLNQMFVHDSENELSA